MKCQLTEKILRCHKIGFDAPYTYIGSNEILVYEKQHFFAVSHDQTEKESIYFI